LQQSTYRDNQIGPFENFHQFGENALVIVGAWFEVFLQYALRLVDGLKNQLLISHASFPIDVASTCTQKRDQVIFGNYPLNFCFEREPWSLVWQQCSFYVLLLSRFLGDVNCRVRDDPRDSGRRAWLSAGRDPAGGGSLVAVLKRMEGCGWRWTDARGSSRPTPISAIDRAAKSRAHSSAGERSLHT
jgi:hypothetical protein